MDEERATRETTVEVERESAGNLGDGGRSTSGGRSRADSLEEARERYLADDPAYDERAYDHDLERLASGTEDLDRLVGDDATTTAWAALAGHDTRSGERPQDRDTHERGPDTTSTRDPDGQSLARVGLVSSAALLWSLQTVFVPAALCVFVYALTFSAALGVTVGLLWLVGSVVFSVSLALTLAGEATFPWLEDSPWAT